VGASPLSGRLVREGRRKFFAYSGKSATPRVDAISDIAIARLSTSWLGLILLPDFFK